MIATEGRRVDAYLDTPARSSTKTVFQSLQMNFEYLECNAGCGTTLETVHLTPEVVATWRIGMMGLRPSILGVAHGTCPVCQDMQKQFSKIIHTIERE